MNESDKVPCFELERILNTTDISSVEHLMYTLGSPRWLAAYSLVGGVAMAGANSLMGNGISVGSSLFCLASSYASVKLSDMLTGDNVSKRDKSDALKRILDLRLQTNLFMSLKDVDHFVKDAEAISYYDIPCSDFMNTHSDVYVPDYLLLHVDSNSNSILFNVDKNVAEYLDGFRDDPIQAIPSDETIVTGITPLVEHGLLGYDGDSVIPDSEFDVFTVGSVDSRYVERNDPLKFIPVSDLRRCQGLYSDDVEAFKKNFYQALADSWTNLFNSD